MIEKKQLFYVSFLTVVAAIGGFLFGYDTAVISGTISAVTEQFDLNVIEQGWYVGSALIGSILGVSVAGWLSDSLGRKKIMMLSAALFSASALGCAMSYSFSTLVLYRIIGGIGIGMVSIVSPVYISEIAITRIRGALVAVYQLAITIGFLGAYLMNFQLLKFANSGLIDESSRFSLIFNEEVWRGMLGMEFVPAFLFFVIIIFIPESPRWLIMQNRMKEAETIFEKIYQSIEIGKAKAKEILQISQRPNTSSFELLRNPKVLKPVLLGVAIAILGQFMGVNAVLYYGPSIFEKAGLSGGDALYYQVWIGLVNVLTTIIALLIIDRVGRKKLVYFGVSGMILSLLLISFYFVYGETIGIGSIFLLTLFLFYVFCTAISISAVIFVLLSEMYPNQIRGIAMSIAGFSLWVGTYLIGQLTPFLLENLGPAGTFLLFASMCLPYMFIIWKYIPETAGKSLEEIESYWFGKSS